MWVWGIGGNKTVLKTIFLLILELDPYSQYTAEYFYVKQS
jgi:hypothetical protein